METGRIVNRRPASQSVIEGYAPQLEVLPSPPPRVIFQNEDGSTISRAYPGEFEGQLVAVQNRSLYFELYVFINAPSGDPTDLALEGWKKVDTNWPKIDPNTGEPEDQYLDWYSPLAK